MSFKLTFPRNPRIQKAAKTASTAYAADIAVAPDADASGQAFTAATSATIRIIGILQQVVASTDSDYATAGAKKNVLIDEDGEWIGDVGTGTADANDEQGYIDFKDEDELDVTASTTDAFYVTRYISGTKVAGNFTGWAHRYSPAAD